MHRYIAFAWNTEIHERNTLVKTISRRLKSQLPDWQCALDTSGLLVYHVGAVRRASQAYQLDRMGGIVLGKVFDKDRDAVSKPRDVVFTKNESEEIISSNGRILVERYWGRYVAIVKESVGPRVWILRDPTGAVPCFLSVWCGINVVCSHVDDCATLELVNANINWDHIAEYLWNRHLVTSVTGLKDVKQIQAGECIEIGADSSRSTYYWSPHLIQKRRIVEDRREAMREIRNVIHMCVGAWASCFDNILLELSGGLDSAVVLACLSSGSTSLNIVCENFFTENAESDERVYARQAAKLAGVELIETPIPSLDRSLESIFQAEKCATPTYTVFVPETQQAREQLATTYQIEAVFSGNGGDNFFQRSRTPQIAAEYAWRHGLRTELFDIVSDTARFTRKPIWTIIGCVITSGLLRRHYDPYASIIPSPLLSDTTVDAMSPNSIRHPWIDTAIDLPGSKQQQIFNILNSQKFFRVPAHYADVVHPLISQPVIELSLQIPSYVLTYGGIDRALVRQAFAGFAAHDSLTRTTKGAVTSYFNGFLLRNLPFLREYLLDGLLAGAGLIDKRKTEVALAESSLIRDLKLLFPILAAARAEFWLRSWIDKEQRAVA